MAKTKNMDGSVIEFVGLIAFLATSSTWQHGWKNR